MEKESIIEGRNELLAAIQRYCKENGITQVLLSEKTGLIQSNIVRIFSGKYSPTLDTLLTITEAIGLKISLVSNGKELELRSEETMMQRAYDVLFPYEYLYIWDENLGLSHEVIDKILELRKTNKLDSYRLGYENYLKRLGL